MHWQRHGHWTKDILVVHQQSELEDEEGASFLALVSDQVPSQAADVLEEKEDFFWSLLLKENDWFPLLFASVIQLKPMVVKRK